MKERIIKILSNFGIDKSAVSDDANFMKDLGFDSLDTVDLMMQLEMEFNISIPDEDYTRIVTVQSLVVYLEERQQVLA
jgi:acyl carrier protein